MHYIEFKEKLKNFTVFSLTDIKKLGITFHRRRLNEWQDKGYIKKVIKGCYVFSDLELEEKAIFEIANRIYVPSYISLEMALSYYNLIPETVYTLTSISTRKTYTLDTPLAKFIYRSIKPQLFFGYELIEYKGKSFKIASPEKAVLDYFYFHPELKNNGDFAEIRMNKDIFFEVINEKKLKIFLKKFPQKILTKRLSSFLGFMKHA